MPEPYDYTSAFAGLPAPGDSFLAGIKNGAALTDIQTQRAQQARDLAAQQQKKQVIQALVSNPNATADDYAKATVLVPELHAQFKQAWDTKSTAQQQNDLKRITEWSAAIQSGQPKIASDAMRSQADAIENTSGAPTPESKALRAKADQVDGNPQAANFILKSMIAAHPNGKAAIDGIVALGGEQRAADLAPAAVRKANADAGTAETDSAAKNLGIVAQRAGALAKPGVKPAQVQTMFRTLATQGLIPKDELQGYIDGIPTDPKDLPAYLERVRDAGIKPDKQKEFTTPDANTVANNATNRYTADSTARTAGARLAFDRDQAAAEDAPDNTPENEKKLWVHQYVAGNGSVPRSAPASVRSHIGTWAAQMGITPADLSSGSAQAKFDQASAVTSGHRAGGMASVEASMPALTANAMSLSRKLDQGKFVPLNKLVQMADDKISDPTLAAFKVAHMAVVSEYQQVIGRGGTNVTALKEAMHVLNGATSPQAYDAALNQVNKEVAINVAGTKAVRAGLGAGGHGVPTPAASAAPAIPAGWSVKVH